MTLIKEAIEFGCTEGEPRYDTLNDAGPHRYAAQAPGGHASMEEWFAYLNKQLSMPTSDWENDKKVRNQAAMLEHVQTKLVDLSPYKGKT